MQKRLRQAYSASKRNSGFEVSCIDNDTYADAADADDEELLAHSGARRLRLFCHKIAAEARSGAAEFFMTNQVPSLLSSFDLQI